MQRFDNGKTDENDRERFGKCATWIQMTSMHSESRDGLSPREKPLLVLVLIQGNEAWI